MNLYIFNKTSLGAVYGIGTYIRELVFVMKMNNVNVYVVTLYSDRLQIQMEEIDGINHWFFPVPAIPQGNMDDHK
ncbi:MAG: hypothetical protein LIP05_09515 [Tannerellaceae bacterium]|nr:hypothetical protein [Tannerellaceae bacterium]